MHFPSLSPCAFNLGLQNDETGSVFLYFASHHCCRACLSVLIICCPDNEFKVEPRSVLLIRIITSKCIWYLMPIWLIAMGLAASVRVCDLFPFSFGCDPFISIRFAAFCCVSYVPWYVKRQENDDCLLCCYFTSVYIPRIPSHPHTHKREQKGQRNNNREQYFIWIEQQWSGYVCVSVCVYSNW